MSEKEEFERKLKIRLEAYRNLGAEKTDSKNTAFSNKQINELCQLIEMNLKQADDARNLVYFKPVVSGTGWMGRLKRLVKRIVRKMHFKLFGWMVIPFIDQQNMYNGKILNAVMELRDIVILQEMEREAER